MRGRGEVKIGGEGEGKGVRKRGREGPNAKGELRRGAKKRGEGGRVEREGGEVEGMGRRGGGRGKRGMRRDRKWGGNRGKE